MLPRVFLLTTAAFAVLARGTREVVGALVDAVAVLIARNALMSRVLLEPTKVQGTVSVAVGHSDLSKRFYSQGRVEGDERGCEPNEGADHVLPVVRVLDPELGARVKFPELLTAGPAVDVPILTHAWDDAAMPTGVYSLRDAGVMVDLLGKEMREAASRGLLSAANRAVAHIVGEVIPGLEHPPVDRGHYRAAWRAKRDGHDAVVENLSPYAPMIEDGIRPGRLHPGRTLIEALTAWVKRKRLGGRTVTSKSGKVRHVAATETEARRIAWAIAKAVEKRGRPGLHVLERASARFPGFIAEEVRLEMRAV
jgi:hypothetical protein